MKKRLVALLVLVLVMMLALVSCGDPLGDWLNQIKPGPEPEPEKEVYVVYFSTDEGSHVPSQDVKEGDLVTRPEDPTKNGFEFTGWYKDAERTSPWNFDSDKVEHNTIIYAKWVAHKGGTPTCTSGPICESCGKEYGKPLGHTEEIIPGKAPTCKEAGLTDGKKCSVCGETLVAQEEIPATGEHTWGDWIVDKAATDTEDGAKHRDCSVCGDREDATIPNLSHTHSYKSEVTTNPGCETKGEMTFTCGCGHSYTEEIPATGHAWNAGEDTTAPGCETKGEKTFTCQNDASHTYTEEIPATGHAWNAGEVTTAPGCETKGEKTFTCQNDASHTYTEEIPATGHAYDEGEVTKEATYGHKGTKTFTCQNDKTHTKTEDIAQLTLADNATAEEIVNAAYTLEKGEALIGEFTLTGVITKVDFAYNSYNKNISIIIKVTGADESKTIYCYKLVGDDIDKIVAGDTVTITGPIKNYNGKVEFDQGCELVSYTEHAHQWSEATCKVLATCSICGKTTGEPADHTYGADNKCTVCGHDKNSNESWVLVTDVAQLKDGAEIVIVAAKHNFAIGSQNGSYRNRVSVVKNADNTVTINSDVQIITIVIKDGKTLLQVGDNQYLYAVGGSNNHVKTSSTINDAAKWDITISNGTATIKSNVDSTRNTLMYNANSGQERFSCYAGTQEAVAIYIKTTTVHTCTPADAVKENEVAPTCTTAGSYDEVVYCSECEKEISRRTVTVNALGHDMKTDAAVAPTCESTGLTEGSHCSRCDHKVAQEVVPALGHKWNDGVVTTAPTCEGKGVKTFTCQNDATHTKTEDVAATGHEWDEGTVTTAPSCESTGVKTYTCKNDATHKTTETIPATGHTDNDDNNVCDVCTKPVCGKDDHKYVGAETTAPTCTTVGTMTYTCSACGDSYTEDIAINANAHNYDEGVVTTPATCSTKGVKTFTCQHNSAHTYTKEVAIDATAHNYDEGVVTTPATCSAKGVKTFTCQHNSEHTYTEEVAIDEDAHSYDEGVVTVAPTCSAKGEKTFTCQHNSEHTYTEEVAIDENAHQWNEGEVTKEATYGHAGVKTFTCLNDVTHTETEPIDQLVLAADATAEEIVNAAYSLAKDESLSNKQTLTGVITQINTAYDTGYKNVTVTIKVNGADATKTIQCYRMKGTDADKIGVGDTITVSGKIKNFNGTIEFDSGCTLDSYTIHECDWSEATCKAPATCSLCGKTEGELAEHKYVDGVCSVCGVNKNQVVKTTSVVIKNYATSNGWKDATKYTTLTVNEFVTAIFTGKDNTGKYYTNGNNWRMYQTESATLTFSASEGVTIVSVKITYVSEKTGILTLNGAQINSGTVVTVNANSVKFGIGNTGSATNGQVRISSIEVTYAYSAPEQPEVHTHTGVKVDGKAATCAVDGWKDYYQCSDETCAKIFSDAECTEEITDLDAWKAGEGKISATGAHADTNPADHKCDVCGETVSTHTGGEATCTAKAVCEICKQPYGDLANHSYEPKVTDPTCEEPGYRTYTCSVCGDSYKDPSYHVDSLGHKGSVVEIENDIPATCTTSGSYDNVIYCTVCNKELSRTTITVDAKGHNYHSYTQIDPSCTTEGLKVTKCTRTECDYYKEDVIPAVGHKEETIPGKAATCTEDGLTGGKQCTVCKVTTVEQTKIPAAGHKEVTDKAVDATCTATGLTEGKHCSVCNTVLVAQTTVDALGHDKVSHDAKAATCTEAGYEAYETCRRCNYTTYVEIPALEHIDEDNNNVCDRENCKIALCEDDDHIENAGEVTTPATCVATGTRTFKCTACGKTLRTEEIAIDENAHNMVEMPSKAATCTEDGHSVYDACTLCGHEEGKNTLVAPGHFFKIDVAAKAATCTEAGYTATERCWVCDYTKGNEPIDALGHDKVSHDAKAATCTEAGYEAYETCSRCNYTTYVEIPALGHRIENAPKINPTCTEEGHTAYKECVREGCDYETPSAVIPALGHDKVSHDAKAANCTEIGWNAYETCSRCNYTTYVEIPDLGHRIENAPKINPTCTKEGHTAYQECVREGCDYETPSAVIPALGHTAVVDAAVAATCTATGLTEGSHCSVCEAVLVAQTVVEINPDAHKWGEGIVTTTATCGTVGVKTYTCQNDATHTKTEETGYNTYNHIYDNGVETTAPTYGHEGVKTFTCTENASHTYETKIPMLVLEGDETAAEIVDAAYTLINGETIEKSITLSGVITKVDTEYSSTYKNVTVTIKVTDADETKPIMCFRMKGDGADLVGVGDTITVTGTIKNYEGTIEFDSGCTLDAYTQHTCAWSVATCKEKSTCSICGATTGNYADHIYTNGVCTVCGVEDGHEHADTDENLACDTCGLAVIPAVETEISIKLAIALGASKDHNTYTDGKYYVTGTITEIYNADYGNMYITDGNGNTLTIYGSYNADGTVGYASMNYKHAVGQTVTVYGIVGQYNSKAQIKNGWVTIVHEHAGAENVSCLEANICTTCGHVIREALESHTYVDGTCSVCGATESTGGEVVVPTTVTASKTVAELITEYGWTSSTTKQSFNLDENVTVKINGGSNTGKAYDGTNIRIYATDTPAGTITISVADGYELVSIKITTLTGTYAFLCVDGTTTDISNVETAVSGSTVVLNSVKNGSDGKQVRVTAMEVVYKASAGETLCAHFNDETLWGEGVVTAPTCTEKGVKTFTCSTCGDTKTEAIDALGHSYGEGVVTTAANCTEKGVKTFTCTACGDKKTEAIDALGHTTTDGVCERCNETIGGDTPEPTIKEITFDLGANGSASHNDGSEKTSSSYTVDGYTLSITSGTKMYTGARDAKGNSCIKFGTSKAVGSMTFTVPDNVEKVIIYIAGYKAATSTNIKINGTQYNVKTASNNGEYTAIEIDTTATKTITFTTVTYRAMLNTIVFKVTE